MNRLDTLCTWIAMDFKVLEVYRETLDQTALMCILSDCGEVLAGLILTIFALI